MVTMATKDSAILPDWKKTAGIITETKGVRSL